jgi:hypothetical protein
LYVDLGWQGMPGKSRIVIGTNFVIFSIIPFEEIGRKDPKRTPFQQKDIQKNDLQFASVILCKPALIEFGIFEKPFF